MLRSNRKNSSSYWINNKNKFKYQSVKICILYLILALNWEFISDRVAKVFFISDNSVLTCDIYKDSIYILVTTYILYLLINKFLKRVFSVEKQLKQTYIELEEYKQQLIDREEELRIQYDYIKEEEKKLSKSQEKSRAIIKAIPDTLFIIDSKGVFIDCETNEESKLLHSREEFIGKTIAEIMPKEVSDIAYKNLKLTIESGQLHTVEYELIDKEILGYYEIRMVKKSDNEILAILRDITRRKELENSLEYLSYKDPLTGLYNRRFYEEELKRLDVKENLPLTIVLGDVNGLKLINDSFGHVLGDELINKVAEIIKSGCRKDDIVARLAGDEFIILLPKTDSSEAEKVIKNINRLAEKEKVQNIDISISFGYETKRNDKEDIQEIFTKAEDYMYKRKLFESSCMKGKTVNTIINTINEKNKGEEEHSFRVSELCGTMGEILGLDERKIQELKTAGLLHDIGKVAIDGNILNKPSKLTCEEYNEVKRHSEIGYRILNTINEMSEIAEYILLHHEMWNGQGYPKGLQGNEIPLESRIIAIADAYDSMSSERVYRSALPKEFIIEELKQNSGIQFDAKLVNEFIDNIILSIYNPINNVHLTIDDD